MAEASDAGLHERVKALEKTVADQEAVIDGMRMVLADILAAQAVQHRDLRLTNFLKERRDSDVSLSAQGGTDRTAEGYFDARAGFLAELLEAICNSSVFEQFWSRSLSWGTQKRQRRELEKIRYGIAMDIER
jgi:uncharacterized coiled-coil protein SlyX/uncharacterized protein YjiS (DUF1127 family)